MYEELGKAITQFQSTPPVRGATHPRFRPADLPTRFQSTPPVRGATLIGMEETAHMPGFNPRPP